MAEKLIQITVRATLKDAQDKLDQICKNLKQLEAASATAGLGLSDLSKRTQELGQRAAQARAGAQALGKDLEKEAEAAQHAGGALERLGQGVMGLIAAYAGMRGIGMAWEMAEMAATNQDIAEGFTMMTDRIGVDGERLVKELQDAARGTITQYDIMLMATKALDLGLAASTDDLVKLMEIAHVRAKRYGQDTGEYFGQLIQALASGRPQMLTHLGFLEDTEVAYDAVAESMGRNADELTVLQQRQAVLQAVLQTGQSDLEAWGSTADDASDAFERWDVATAVLRQEIGELLLPAVQRLTEALLSLQAASQGYEEDAKAVVDAVLDEGGTVDQAAEKLEEYNRAHLRGREGLQSWQDVLDGVTISENNLAIVNQALGERWGQMYQEADRARIATQDLGDAQVKLADDTEDASKAASRASGAWHDYLTRVESENWSFAQSVSEAQFRAAQAAEDGAFRLGDIERDAAQNRADTIEQFNLSELDELEKHQMEMRWERQDHLDALADMEWQHQQDKKQLLNEAPWWVRQALGKEFAERERIARTGDKQALAEYDKYLQEKIRAVDPAYAKLVQKQEDQYKHDKNIENRENKQSLSRQEEQFDQENRAQEQQFNLQLRQTERELEDQLRAWEFHDQQRRENEEQAMNELLIEHAHKLDKMYEDTQYKLSQLPSLYYDAGYSSGVKWGQGFDDATKGGSSPSTGYDPNTFVNPFATAQFGMPYVPRTMPVMVHQGEAILSPGQANQWRGGSISIGEIHVHGNYTPFLAQKVATEVATELGKMTVQRSR